MALLLELDPLPEEEDGLDEEEDEEARGSLEEEDEEARGSDGMRVNGSAEKVLRIPRKARMRMTMESGWRKRLWVGGEVSGTGYGTGIKIGCCST